MTLHFNYTQFIKLPWWTDW